MPSESIGGSQYFVTFVDDYSRYCRVYFMQRKSEDFDKFELCTTNECGLIMVESRFLRNLTNTCWTKDTL